MDWPKLIIKPEGSNVVILAPHPDDEIMGCGGVIQKHLSQGDQLHIIYMTDGSRGTSDMRRNLELTSIRKKELKNSNALLGVKEYYHLDIEDSSPNEWSDYSDRFIGILLSIEPTTVYLPFFNDIHEDHQRTTILFSQYLQLGKQCSIYAYEVCTPFTPNRIVNITRLMDIKIEALRCHESQFKVLKYDKMVLHLNSFRACFIPFPGMEYAEAFYYMNTGEYLTLYNNFFWKKTNKE